MKSVLRFFQRVLAYFLLDEGSTRPLAILRIGIVLLLWARFARDLTLFRHPHPLWMLTSLLFFIVTPLLFFGLWSRLAAIGTAIVATLLLVLGHWLDHEPYRHHHVWLLLSVTLLVPFGPCGRSYSVDRWLALRKGTAQPERGSLLAQRLMCLQVSAVYFFGAFDKTNLAFLSGARMEHFVLAHYGQVFHAQLPEVFGFGAMMTATAVVTVLLEYALAFGLYVRRAQFLLIVFGIVFHIVIYATLSVLTFSATICLLYVAFLDPDAVHRFIDRLHAPDPA